MNAYRKALKKSETEILSTEQQISNLQLEIIQLKELIHQHPNILLQLKYNQLSVEVKKLNEKFNKPNYYKYLFVIILIFNILKFISK